MIALLCENGAYVRAEDAEAQSPLMVAVTAGRHATVRLLVSTYRADLNTYSLNGENALWVVIRGNHGDLLKEFLESRQVGICCCCFVRSDA